MKTVVLEIKVHYFLSFSFVGKSIFIMFLQQWVNNALKYESVIWKNLLTFLHFTALDLLGTTLTLLLWLG